MSILCHFLIGTPASGKSTFAKNLQAVTDAEIVSTDGIRKELYGDESIQGDWLKIEATTIARIKAAIAEEKSVIYDATNAKRAWRMSMLMKLKDMDAEWMGWWLKTDLGVCQKWNRGRKRNVPNWVIETYYDNLKKFPPQIAEGFVAVNEIKGLNKHDNKKFLDIHLTNIQKKIDALQVGKRNRANRVQNYTLHQYSHLIDFDRLLHLISLMLRYPGIGNLPSETLKEIFDVVEPPIFKSSLDEISAIIAYYYGEIYSDRLKLESDLIWLEDNKLLDLDAEFQNLEIKTINDSQIRCHAYSDLDTFSRLIYTIRLIIKNPFISKNNVESETKKGSLQNFVDELNGFGYISTRDNFRKDLQNILKPYKILPDVAMRKGYFAGTAIFNKQEIEFLFNNILVPNSNHIQDPIYLGIYEKLKQKVDASKLVENSDTAYPVRVVKDSSIVDTEKLIDLVDSPLIYKPENLIKLEEAIAQRQLIQLNTLKGSAFFPDCLQGSFLAYPLQLVFDRIGWYLGFEVAPRQEKAGLLKFERLDRLTLDEVYFKETRSPEQHKKSLDKLTKLYKACPSLFLGNEVEDQNNFLVGEPDATIEVKLLFNDKIFSFIAEGTKRFPRAKIKMSPPKERKDFYQQHFGNIFCLKRSDHPNFPNQLHLTFPKWSINDVNLKSWILGYDNAVKVGEPQELVNKIKNCGKGIAENYR